jgi:glycosyltransferase involved in cell wall biosynthesis
MNSMKHIVIDARNMPTSTGRYVEMLVRYLEKIDREHRYSILMYPDKMDKWQPSNPNFTAVPCPYKEYTLSEQLGFKRQLESLKPDLVHFSMVQQPILYRGKVVTTMHDLTTIRFRNPAKNWLIFTIKRWAYILVTHVAARKSAAIITPSEFVRQDFADYTHIDPAKIITTHEAVDDFDAPAEEMPFFKGKRFLLADGRPRPHKNLRRIIEAFAIIHRHHPDVYLMLVGKRDPSDGKYVDLITSLGLEAYAIQTDFIPDSQLKWALQNCQAFIYASLSEGFGLIPLEAMINGAPVAISNATCLPEVCGDAGNYFDPYDVNDMARALEELLTNKQLSDTLRERGHQQVKKYSWQRMAQQTLAVYRKALGES